jgi:hypothetical protein
LHVEGRLLVVWMLTPDDGGRDGGFRSHLQDPDRWRPYDPPLFDELANLLRPAQPRDVSLIEQSGLLPDTSYYSPLVPDGRGDREAWRKGLLDAVGNTAWQEIEMLWAQGRSVMVYQHYPRMRRPVFHEQIAREVARHLDQPALYALRASAVVYFLIVQPRHKESIARAVEVIEVQWAGQITTEQLLPTL